MQTSPPQASLFLGRRTAIYPVNDLERAKRGYTEAVGLAPYFDQPFYAGFTVRGFALGLIPDGVAGTHGPQPLWGVTSAEAVLTHLTPVGATAPKPVTEGCEGIRAGAVVDPFGNRLGVIENPGFNASLMR